PPLHRCALVAENPRHRRQKFSQDATCLHRGYLLFFRSRRIASSASITSTRDARLLLKLSFRLKAFDGALKANTKCFVRPTLGLATASRSGWRVLPPGLAMRSTRAVIFS